MTTHTNRLANETSPYLLQHAHNPVDWFPWGEEAFQKAIAENKPVLVSIGYSTCHWCHVMERESFENEEIAALMNEKAVCIKVDREERPDLDALYMKTAMLMTGRGGWPLNVWVDHEKRPFHAGTYYPPQSRGGMPSWPQVVGAISEAWRARPNDIARAASELTSALHAAEAAPSAAGEPTPAPLAVAGAVFARAFDPLHGGFGRAPKFPRPSVLTLLLRLWRGRSRAPGAPARGEILAMVERTLDGMARGGMHDQLGGGFHRYSTDAKWLVPHFEKMLYDQALLLQAYCEAWQATGKDEYAEVCRAIVRYVLRDLTHEGGAFFSGEDADSEGVEGKFWCFTAKELRDLLGEKEGSLIARWFGFSEEGNFEHGMNILHRPVALREFCRVEGIAEKEFLARLERAEELLFTVREKRVRPHRDDKILTGWNGLMIAALTRAGAALDEPGWIEAAEKAAQFIDRELLKHGRLLRTWREGGAKIGAFLEDHAPLAAAHLALYEATFDPAHLKRARALARTLLDKFSDPAGGALFDCADDAELLPVRQKELYDGAQPAGNSVAALVFIRLGRLTGDEALAKAGERIVRAMITRLEAEPASHPEMLQALALLLAPPMEIVIAGDLAADETDALLREIRRRFLPDAVVALRPHDPAARAATKNEIPALAALTPPGGGAWAFLCANYACRRPVDSADALAKQLDEMAGG